jgi:hypothetical protein
MDQFSGGSSSSRRHSMPSFKPIRLMKQKPTVVPMVETARQKLKRKPREKFTFKTFESTPPQSGRSTDKDNVFYHENYIFKKAASYGNNIIYWRCNQYRLVGE